MSDPRAKQDPVIFELDVLTTLNMFGANINDVVDIWQEEGKFLQPQELFNKLIDKKLPESKHKDLLKQLVDSGFNKDQRSGAFTRHSFMYGLADLYAKEISPKAAIIEFDVANAKGTGNFIGDDNIVRVIQIINALYEKSFLAHGAEAVMSFDDARNDDLKILVTGLNESELHKAITAAQEKVDSFTSFGQTIPHTKYQDPERLGLNAGAGYVMLGNGLSMNDIQTELNMHVQDRKLKANRRRYYREREGLECEELSSNTVTKLAEFVFGRYPYKDLGLVEPLKPFPFTLENKDLKGKDKDPAAIRKNKIKAISKEFGLDKEEAKIFKNLLKFYDRPDSYTGARNDALMQADLEVLFNKLDGDNKKASVGNVKIENCAGVYRTLSLRHAEVMTKHFAKLIEQTLCEQLGKDEPALVYFIGMNSFNIIAPNTSEEKLNEILTKHLKQNVDDHINAVPIKDYYGQFGEPLPENFVSKKTSSEMTMGEIPHTRGDHSDGLSLINFDTMMITPDTSMKEITDFQVKARGRDKDNTAQINDTAYLMNKFNNASKHLPPSISGIFLQVMVMHSAEKRKETEKRRKGPKDKSNELRA
jgi:GGDEF domain-containing protein